MDKKWFDDVAKYLQGLGYESALTGDGKFVVFGPQPLGNEDIDRVKEAVPDDMQILVQVGPLHSTCMALDQRFQDHYKMSLKPGRTLVVEIDPRLAEATDEYKLVDAVDEVMARDKYPERYEIVIGDNTVTRYPKLSKDFADHHRLEQAVSEDDILNLRIALETDFESILTR